MHCDGRGDGMSIWMCLGLAIACCGAVGAAIRPADKPGMKIVIEAGDYVSRGQTVRVRETTELSVYGPNMVFVKAEEHALSEDRPRAYLGGTPLAKTFGPVDTGTRLLYAIRPESVKVHSEPDGRDGLRRRQGLLPRPRLGRDVAGGVRYDLQRAGSLYRLRSVPGAC